MLNFTVISASCHPCKAVKCNFQDLLTGWGTGVAFFLNMGDNYQHSWVADYVWISVYGSCWSQAFSGALAPMAPISTVACLKIELLPDYCPLSMYHLHSLSLVPLHHSIACTYSVWMNRWMNCWKRSSLFFPTCQQTSVTKWNWHLKNMVLRVGWIFAYCLPSI